MQTRGCSDALFVAGRAVVNKQLPAFRLALLEPKDAQSPHTFAETAEVMEGALWQRARIVQVKAQQQGSNQRVVSQAMTELLWRDFFRFTSKKYASQSLKQHSSDAVAVCA